MIDINYTGNNDYNTNALGYRAKEFSEVDWNNSYVIQGCSAVFGLGLPNDTDTVSECLSRKLNKPVINLGISGSGIQPQYMNAVEMLEENIKPLGVFIVYPNIHRFSLMLDGCLENFGPWSASRPNKKYAQWMAEDNSKHLNLWHVRAYRLLWKLSGIPLYEVTHHAENTFCKELLDEISDWGTDGQHWGPKTSEIVAEMLYKQVKL